MGLSFTKMHGLGNDFMVVDATRRPFVPEIDWLVRAADRRRGVGFDQLLVVDPAPRADVDFGYRIYNADGSQVGQCGNGARCLAVFIYAQGLSDRRRLRLATTVATMQTELHDDGQVSVDMGIPRFASAGIPVTSAESGRHQVQLAGIGRVEFGVVDVGNPHAVIAIGETSPVDVAVIGAALQARRDLFPQGVNVGFARFLGRDRLRLRVYERGVGETQACGSGACAAVAVGRRWDLLDDRVAVELRGGTLQVCWRGAQQPLKMLGPAETVYEGHLP